MESIIGPILILCLLDMLNPSAIAVTIYLLLTSPQYSTRVLSYAAGMFTTYFGCGLVLMLGLGSVGQALESPVAYAIEGVPRQFCSGTRGSCRGPGRGSRVYGPRGL